MAEKSMLQRKQAIRAVDEELKLDTEIAKAQAREKVFEETNERKSWSDTGESRNAKQKKDQETPLQPPPIEHPGPDAFPATLAFSNLSISSVSDERPTRSLHATTINTREFHQRHAFMKSEFESGKSASFFLGSATNKISTT